MGPYREANLVQQERSMKISEVSHKRQRMGFHTLTVLRILLLLPPDPISILPHPALSPWRMNCMNYNSKLITSDLLLDSAVGDTGEESRIGKSTLPSLSPRGYSRLAASLYQGPLVPSSLGG